MNKQQLKELKKEGTKLDKKVINVLLNQGSTSEIKSYIDDVLNHGCQSGIVGELIYYTDTEKFYNKYKKDINELLTEFVSDTGLQPSELLRDFDKDDFLIQETHNKNVLAWFGCEDTTRKIANHLELEY